MKAWDVTIQATIKKTIRVTEEDLNDLPERTNDDESEAVSLAHTLFTVDCEEDVPERYGEETVKVEEVEESS